MTAVNCIYGTSIFISRPEKLKCRAFAALHEFRGRLRKRGDDHRQRDRRVARYICGRCSAKQFAKYRSMIAAVRRSADIERCRVGRDRDRVFVAARCGSRDVRRNLGDIYHVLAVRAAERDDARMSRSLGDLHHLHRVLGRVERDLDLLFKFCTRNADRQSPNRADRGKRPGFAI